MKKPIFAALFAALTAALSAAPLRMATEAYVTNATSALDESLSSRLSLASRDATNYTDAVAGQVRAEIPTNNAQLANGAGYVTAAITNGLQLTETDPTVPAWAKAASAPLPPDYVAVSNAAKSAATPQQLAAKQDKLPYPTNAIPQGAVSGLSAALNGKLDKTGGTITGDVEVVGKFVVTTPEMDDQITIRDFAGTPGIEVSHWGSYLFPGKAGAGRQTFAMLSDIPNISGKADKADVSAAATAATNYTDAAIGAAIANTNPTFSNAVLSVGLGVDTNTVAVLNEIAADFGGFPLSPGSTATTVGGLLAALAAAVAALKRTKADASALRYAMPASVALVAENDAATLVCGDRAVTNATIASGFSTLNLIFPAEASGYVRDFYLRITVAAGESAPALSLPQGVTIENAGGAVPEIADGEASAAATTLVWFSETAPGVFTAKSETVKAVV